MSDSTGVGRKREANAEDFQRLLDRLSSDPAQAWQLYDTLRQKLVMFFEYHCRFQAEELADEVLDRIAKKSDSYEISNIAEFAFGVARNVRKEASRKTSFARATDAVATDELANPNDDPEDSVISKIDSQRKLVCFLQCMKRLESDDRKLLFQYYPSEESELEMQRARIAEEYQVSISTLRTRMARLREKIERCFENCRTNRKGLQSAARIKL